MASSATATPVSQLSCFSSINRQLQLQRRSLVSFPQSRSRVLIVMRSEGPGTGTYSSDTKRASSYTADDSSVLSSTTEEIPPSMSEPVIQQKRAAKIHDFCLGIPFGGLVLSGGLIGFLLSGNAKSLGTGVLYGGALLALSVLSLKIWRTGKSSLPFILGQAALSAALLWKNLRIYSLTKKVVPTGLNVFISAAMLCFYSYVVLSGGNPPPKKLKTASVDSSWM